MAITIPRARIMPIVETMENEQNDITPKPMITASPEVATDSPAHLTASLRAASLSLPDLRSSLYLEIMKME